MVERYVENGALRIEWRDFAYLGEKYANAAQVARVAQEQSRFWEYHETLYEKQGLINGGTFSGEEVKYRARDVGLE